MDLISVTPELIPTLLIRILPRNEEMQYLEMIKSIIELGNEKEDRTGTGTISKFGSTMRYDLS